MIQGNGWKVLVGNNLELLPTLEDNSVDSIVTDPPYELGFMGKKWDSTGIAYNVELWRECLRVLKPGGHLLSFGGTRTWHRIAVAIEDAGFEVRDSIAWMYGSGFPKSMDVAKAIDKQSGYDGEVIGTETIDAGMQGGSMHAGRERRLEERQIKELSPEAQQWQGWGTALKPAFEPIIVARKPLIGTVAENVLTYGTGGLNIDGSRIGTDAITINTFDNGAKPWGDASGEPYTSKQSHGRWPANIILDEHTAELLDEQSGKRVSGGGSTGVMGGIFGNGKNNPNRANSLYFDKGGASRFFYVAKASKRDRNEGLEELPLVQKSVGQETFATICPKHKTQKELCGCPEWQPVANFHPTVKPTALMEYLIKLVTPPNGLVLDPFTGSGSTGKAALLNGFQFLGMEMTEEYLPIIEGRLKHAEQKSEEGLF